MLGLGPRLAGGQWPRRSIFDAQASLMALASALDPRFTPSFTGLATRWDKDGTLKYRPHNLTVWGGDLTNGTWSPTNGSKVPGQLDPNGGTKAVKLVPNAGSSNFTSSLAILGLTSGSSYVLSAIVKKGEWDHVFLQSTNLGGASTFPKAWFDLTNGTAGTKTSGFTQSGIEPFGNGYYWIWAAGQLAGTSDSLFIFPALADGSLVNTGDGVSGIYVFGAQYETTLNPALGPQDWMPTFGAPIYGPRWNYDPATIDYTIANNNAPNSSLSGSVAGTPGTLPTGMTQQFASGITRTVVGEGIDAATGKRYVDIRLSGTANGTHFFDFGPPIPGPTHPGQDGTGSVFLALVNGTLSNAAIKVHLSRFVPTNGAFDSRVFSDPLPVDGTLRRYFVTYPAGGLSLAFGVSVVIAGTIDLTLRILMPQCDIGTTTPRSYVETTGVGIFTYAFRGMRLEPVASTNLALWSADFTNAVWTASKSASMTVSNVSATAPDGGGTVSRIQYSGAGTNTDTVDQGVTIGGGTASKPFAAAFWVKSNTGSNQTFRLKNTQGGIIDTYSPDKTATTDWQRFELDVTNGANAGNGLQRIGIVPGTGNAAFDVLIYGAQLEQAPAASYYIPTYGAAVTRPADYLDLPVANIPGWNPEQGYVELEWFDDGSVVGAVVGGTPRLVGSDGNAGSAAILGSTGGNIFENDGPGNIITATKAGSGVNKAVFGWDAAGRAICVNSTAVVRDALTPTGIAGITKLSLGTNPARDVTRSCVGLDLRRLRIGTRRPASDADIQALVA